MNGGDRWGDGFPPAPRRFVGLTEQRVVERTGETALTERLAVRGNSIMTSGKRALTRVELVVTVAIIGTLLALIFWRGPTPPHHWKTKQVLTRATIRELAIALTNFERDMGGFDLKVGNEQFPTGELKNDTDRIKLVQILRGGRMKHDGTLEVATDIREDQRWHGPYLAPRPRQLKPNRRARMGQLVDAWGNPLMIRIKRGDHDDMMQHRPDSFEIWSWGLDESDDRGSGDDIKNWE